METGNKPTRFEVSKVDQLLRQLEGKLLSYKMFARDTKASRKFGPPTERFVFYARATESCLPCSQACDGEDDGLFAFDMHSDGKGQRHLHAAIRANETDHGLGSNGSVPGFLPKSSAYSCIQMNGKEVFRFAVRLCHSQLNPL